MGSPGESSLRRYSRGRAAECNGFPPPPPAASCAPPAPQAEILHLLGGHPNIAALRATYEDRRAVHLVMEYCSGELVGVQVLQQ